MCPVRSLRPAFVRPRSASPDGGWSMTPNRLFLFRSIATERVPAGVGHHRLRLPLEASVGAHCRPTGCRAPRPGAATNTFTISMLHNPRNSSNCSRWYRPPDFRRGAVGLPRSGRQGRESSRVKVPLPSIARFGRLAYPLLGEVTNRDMRGRKSHGCPFRGEPCLAVGTTWVSSKPRGLNMSE